MTTTKLNSSQIWDFSSSIEAKANTTRSTFVAWENISAWNALYLHTDWKVYKTDATSTTKINFIWFATQTVLSNANVIVDTSWVSLTQSGLTVGSDYCLSNTPWAISTTPWTNVVSVGNAVSANWIQINTFDDKADVLGKAWSQD